ncbi:hypothetical protein R0K30_23800, partial [Bacillus sp. SIMBA_154]|uniref:hypothetical protein n=1 Tax=Bacillus sp. SIMBA_154 TaxID=3080859 RepID=UPI00397C2C03
RQIQTRYVGANVPRSFSASISDESMFHVKPLLMPCVDRGDCARDALTGPPTGQRFGQLSTRPIG